MKYFLHKLHLFLLIAIGSVAVLWVVGFALLQTSWVQTILVNRLVTEVRKEGFELTVENVDGTPPFKWSFEKITAVRKDGTRLEADDVKLRIAVLPLLKKQVSVSFLSIRTLRVSIPSLSGGTPSLPESFSPTLPFRFSTDSFGIKDLIIEDLSSQKTLHLSLTGRVEAAYDLSEVLLNLSVHEQGTHNSLVIRIEASEKRNRLEGKIDCKLPSGESLSQFLQIPVIASFETAIRAYAPREFLKQLSLRKGSTPLTILGKAVIRQCSFPDYTLPEGPFSFETELSLRPDLSLTCLKAKLSGPGVQLLAKGKLTNSLTPVSGAGILTLSDFSLPETVSSFPIKGSLEIKVALNDQTLKAEIDVSSLAIGSQEYTKGLFSLKAAQENSGWEGRSDWTLDRTDFSWQGSCDFSLRNEKLDLRDISLQISSGIKLSGHGLLDIRTLTGKGDFFILAESLRPLQTFFPSSDIDGRLGGTISVAKDDGWTVASNLLIKNGRYRRMMVNTAKIETELKGLPSVPSGLFSLDCENMIFEEAFITKLLFTSQPEETGGQNFALETRGEWKREFDLSAKGLIHKKYEDWSIRWDECSGFFPGSSFALQNPFSVGKNKSGFFLNDLSVQIGDGNFRLTLLSGANEFRASTQASHLPLDTLSLLYPKIRFHGQSSFQGTLEAKEERVEGQFLATLEEADFSQGSRPVKAKGSLQLHFSSFGAQVHAHLYATQEQFLDWTMTCPLNYDYSPFRISLNKERPVSCEVTLQGAVEEVFDFMNAAGYKASGWVTGRMLLSGSFGAPSLQGSFDLQNGSYENYFTGTLLKDVQADAEAFQNKIFLRECTARDGSNGSLTAEGSLQIDPNGDFPFQLRTILNDMHLIRSKVLDGRLTGSLETNGDKKSASIEGDLFVNKAEIKIFEALPIEIPSLDVTYVNKPIHLRESFLQKPVPYPLNLNLEVSADDTVFLTGKGLTSEWQGRIRLMGTPGNLSGSGSLHLKKGEFKFSGKLFTLTQGEISFSDKTTGGYLKLSGELQLSNITVFANLQGPLTSPKLSFQSVPALPTSSILSMILFNKDISEISALQAIQLAQVVVSLSGSGGPDVLEAIRKSLGVDRLNIVGKDGTDEISVQIGWYLARGVTVSLSQSATSSDVTVEVDLKNGFIFQAETQNQEEGKFSLKWNRNY